MSSLDSLRTLKTLQIDVLPWTTLLDLLREQLDLTGTKKGCDHGRCRRAPRRCCTEPQADTTERPLPRLRSCSYSDAAISSARIGSTDSNVSLKPWLAWLKPWM